MALPDAEAGKEPGMKAKNSVLPGSCPAESRRSEARLLLGATAQPGGGDDPRH